MNATRQALRSSWSCGTNGSRRDGAATAWRGFDTVSVATFRTSAIVAARAFGGNPNTVRALQFAQDRLAMGGSRTIRRPAAISIVMWFSVLYAIAALFAVFGVIEGFVAPPIGGTEVTREHWMQIAGPVVGSTALLMLLTGVGLRWHQPWARWTFTLVWPVIAVSAAAGALLEELPWSLAARAILSTFVVGLFASWLLFRSRTAVLYFYRIRQSGGGRSRQR